MSNNPYTFFFAKILLVGEYLVLNGSAALAIPLSQYFGYWDFNDKMDLELQLLCEFLEKTNTDIDIIRLKQDIDKGLTFISTIPRGYGVGSSGALVAAIYNDYKTNKVSDKLVQTGLSKIESYYHGNSSGIDPMVSYFNTGVLINNSTIEKITAPKIKNIYLYDSTRPRTTDKLVNEFHKRQTSIKYKLAFEELANLNEELISAFLTGNIKVQPIWRKISEIQIEVFDFAIPEDIKYKWLRSFDNGEYFKLCGAGGGGFFLVHSENKNNDLIPISK